MKLLTKTVFFCLLCALQSVEITIINRPDKLVTPNKKNGDDDTKENQQVETPNARITTPEPVAPKKNPRARKRLVATPGSFYGADADEDWLASLLNNYEGTAVQKMTRKDRVQLEVARANRTLTYLIHKRWTDKVGLTPLFDVYLNARSKREMTAMDLLPPNTFLFVADCMEHGTMINHFFKTWTMAVPLVPFADGFVCVDDEDSTIKEHRAKTPCQPPSEEVTTPPVRLSSPQPRRKRRYDHGEREVMTSDDRIKVKRTPGSSPEY